ncbi:MAG: hypothetical protein C0501_06385 [Isosphaera sp.]|nr:hypothetical protein [Isosphaera sp.]
MRRMRDIEVISPTGRTQVVVEVKRLPRKDKDWAFAFYQLQIYADPDGLEVPYFLLVLSDRMFLWKAGTRSAPRPPDLELDTAEVLERYLPHRAAGEPPFGGEALTLAVGAWLDDLAFGDSALLGSEWAGSLAGIGLLDAVRGGRVRYGALA